MSERSDLLREVDWQGLCPWLILVRALRVALTARVLLLALLGLVAATAGHRLVNSLFFRETSDRAVTQWREVDSRWPWDIRLAVAGNNVVAGPIEKLRQAEENSNVPPPARPAFRLGSLWDSRAAGWMASAWEQVVRPIARLFELGLSWRGVAYTLLCGIWSIIVWAMFGGAITRIAALDLTRREQLGFRGAVVQTSQQYTSFLAAALLPLAAVAFVAGPLVVTGWLVGITFFAWLAGVFWFIVLALGLALAILLILFAIGWPLMWATLSVERTDAFDAWSRAYAYAYQRPLRLLFYVLLVAVGLGTVGSVVVQVVAGATIWLSDWAISWGAGNAVTEKLDAYSAIQFWKGLVTSVVAAFPFGLLWTSSVAIYLLQRQAIDGVAMDDVALEEPDESYGLPSLSPHPSGVPEIQKAAESASPTEQESPATEPADKTDEPEGASD